VAQGAYRRWPWLRVDGVADRGEAFVAEVAVELDAQRAQVV
jgi:hypothetical protein